VHVDNRLWSIIIWSIVIRWHIFNELALGYVQNVRLDCDQLILETQKAVLRFRPKFTFHPQLSPPPPLQKKVRKKKKKKDKACGDVMLEMPSKILGGGGGLYAYIVR
jgi:hypothetical protein